MLQPSDLERIETIEWVGLRPGSDEVAWLQSRPDSESNRYVRTLWLSRLGGAGTAGGAPLLVAEHITLPRWAPDGSALAAVSTTGELIRYAATDGYRPDPLLSLPDPALELAWSPGSDQVAVVTWEPIDRERELTTPDRQAPVRLTTLRYAEDGVGWTATYRSQIFTTRLDEPGLERVSDGEHSDRGAAWHPDGSRLYFLSERHPDADLTFVNDLFEITLATWALRRLTGTTHDFAAPCPSPDGSHIAVGRTDTRAFPASAGIASIDAASGELTDLTAGLDRDCDPSSVRWQGESAVDVLVHRDGRVEVVRLGLDGTAPQALLTGDVQVAAFDSNETGWAAAVAAPDRLPMLIGGTGPLSAATQVSFAPGTNTPNSTDLLHDPNETLRSERQLVAPAYRPVQVSPEVTVDAWLGLPPGVSDSATAEVPLIIWLQGGGTQYGYQFSHEVQTLIAAGYAVAYLNARGSAGYGTSWMRSVSAPAATESGTGWGSVDVDDVAAVTRALLADHPALDPERVGVMGGSYGGLMTAMMLAKTDLFAAGWAERGPYNLVSDAGTLDESPWFFDGYLGVSHLEDLTPFWDASPLKYVKGITAPLIIVHSEEDRRCPVQQAEELFHALRVLGRTVEFVRFPAEGHGLTRNGSPVHRGQRTEILLEWFGRWLRP